MGAGRVGTSLARLLRVKGWEIKALVCRSMQKAEAAARLVGAGVPTTESTAVATAQVVFLTVPDNQIAEVSDELGRLGLWQPHHHVVHCSGCLGVDVLSAAAQAGAAVLSFHPLQSIADAESGVKLIPGSFFALEGCERGRVLGHELVAQLGGTGMTIRAGGKPYYHAAAVVMSNYLVSLTDVAMGLMHAAGVEAGAALGALLSLGSGALSNMAQQGVLEALTGPIERGDDATVREHLRVLAGYPEEMRVYRELGRRTARLALAKGAANPVGLRAVSELLERD